MDYSELVKKLRNRRVCIQSGGDLETDFLVMREAADAIVELQATLCNWCAVCPEDKRDLSTCEIYESFGWHGCEYGEPKPQTNADRIRAMTDEELAWLLCRNGWFIESYALDWLKSPVEVDDGT